MRENGALPAGLRIRRGSAADVELVRSIAVDVFSRFGDYGRILPGWLLHDGVLTHVAEEGALPGPVQKLGYTMLGFYPVPKEIFVADLLAIAVAPAAQGRGVGRHLLEHAIAHVRSAKRRLPLREMRLSVAEDNLRARRMFEKYGFHVLEGDHGWYDGGQLALHMTRAV
jgi:ribosomal protein S18 acetylase RimI-like enzyme